MVDLFCHNLGAIKTHTLRSLFAMMKTMRALILIISLITIVSCCKEPSLLDKCITSNQEEFNFFDKWRTWGKENIQLQKKHLPSGDWETIELNKDYHRIVYLKQVN